MELDNDNIKDLFSSKLNGFEPEVPASVWGGIDQLLSQVPSSGPTPDASASQASNVTTAVAKSGGAALKTTLIAASVAASVATGVYLVYDLGDADVPQIVEEIQPKEIVIPSQEEEMIEEPTTKVLAQSDFVRPRVATRHAQVAVEDNQEEETVETAQVEVLDAKEEAKIEETEVLGVEEAEALLPLPSLPKFLSQDISIGVRTNAGALSSSVNENGGDLLFSKNDRSSQFADALKDENKEYDLDHKQPISVGLTVSKSLSRNLSLETGLMFTYLSSRIRSNSSANIKEEQNFGYLGIPIYLNYTFYELHKAKFYISLGAMMQKDVYGRYTSRFVNGAGVLDGIIPASAIYSEPSYLKKNISQSHWQLSSHLNVGVSYPIYRKLYIYTSVGGAYYFDAGNEYRTIYSDRQFQLDLNLGLRFDF